MFVKVFIDEVVDNPEKDYVYVRLRKMLIPNHKDKTAVSLTKTVDVRSFDKKITKLELVEKGLTELNKTFEKDAHVVIYCG
jgi:hypothetical protein